MFQRVGLAGGVGCQRCDLARREQSKASRSVCGQDAKQCGYLYRETDGWLNRELRLLLTRLGEPEDQIRDTISAISCPTRRYSALIAAYRDFKSTVSIARDSIPPEIIRALNPFCRRMRVAP